MKTKFITSILLLAAVFAAGARAQTVQAAAPVPAAPAIAPAAPALAPNQMIYAQRLPSVSELTNIATAQGLTIDRIEQSASQVAVVYKYANGQTNTVAYLLLPNGAAPTPQVVVPNTPPPAAVYEPTPGVVYYAGSGPYYAYPGYYWYPPVSIALGFGYRGGYYGGFRGGFRHW